MTADESPTRRVNVVLLVAVAALAVVAAGLIVATVGGGDDGDEATVSPSTIASGPDVEASPSEPSETDDETVDGSASAPTTEGSAEPTTTVAGLTTDTVEADPEPDGPEPDETADVDEPPDPDDTVPTTSPPVSGACRIDMAVLAGRSGSIEVGSDGACSRVGATITPVNAREDLTAADWGRDLSVCNQHPSATGVSISVATGAGSVALEPTFTRDPADGAADPVQAIEIDFGDGFAEGDGVRPLVSCRSAAAELSIVHRPAR